MDLFPGRRFADCFEESIYEQKTRATDPANVPSLDTSSYCGSMRHNQSLTDGQHSPRYVSAAFAPPPQGSLITTFQFSQGDLSEANIFLDPETGAVTGIIDWEISGFHPAWLTAAGPA